LQAVEWDTDWILQKIMQRVMTETYNFLDAQENLLSQQTNLEDIQVTFDAAEELYQKGLRSVTDVNTMKAVRSDLKIAIALQRAEADVALGRLASTLGFRADEILEIASLPDPIVDNPGRQNIGYLLMIAKQRRADLLSKKADVLRQKALQEKAKAEYMPTFSFNGDAGYKRYEHDRANGLNYSLSLSLDIPLFTGFEATYQNRAAYADVRATEAELDRLELEIAFEVLAAVRLFEAAEEVIQLSAENFKNASNTYEDVLERYKAGTHSIFDLTAAQGQLADARIKLGQAKTRWYKSLAELAFATGTITNCKED
jgi:outer membrane protein